MKRFYRMDVDGTPRHAVEENGEWRLVEGDIFDGYEPGARIAPAGHRLLAPVTPSKIVAVGLNYRDHAAEQNKPLPAEPMIFIKPSTAVIGPDAAIVLPRGAGRVDHEAEVGVVIGTRTRHVSERDAARSVLGLTCVNDVTARELQSKDIQYTRAKGFDTFAPIGPSVAVGLDYHRPEGLRVEGWVNGARRQASSTRELIFSIDRLIAFISSVMTLLPGDVISTGTPAGIGPLAAGDRVMIKVEGVGELSNPVLSSE
ncbi:MAG TPA: fumarylacetoacetate hydrolase family protein [Vicinamibacterales bacterium]|nr:fumarylacetoacetate hydrolase family protein [Vicinamibacterales bacterium]